MPSSGVGEESFRSPTIFVDRWPDWGLGVGERRVAYLWGACARRRWGSEPKSSEPHRSSSTLGRGCGEWCNRWSVVVVFVAGVVDDDEAVGLAADGSGCDDLAIGDIDGHDLPVEWIGDPHVVV